MALIISDRVKETTTTQGTGSLTLSGATFGGFQTFSSAIGNGNTTYYCIQNESNFEIGIGTFSSGSLSRDTVLQSSNSDSKISLSGASTVFCVIPADRIVYKDADNAVVFPTPFVFKRSDDGDYWQAYSTDYGTRVVSMFMSEGFDPEWKIGLKTSSSDSVEPTYGYISGKDGFVELKGSSQSILNLGSATSEGFKVSHRLTTIIHLKENGGEIFVDSLNIKNADISQDVLSVEAGVGHVANLQTWNVSTSEKASIDAEGNFNTVGNISGVTGVFSAINFADGTIQTSAALPSSSGYLIDQNAADIITVSGIAAAGGGGDVKTEQLNYVSGIAVYGSGQAVANQADILAVSGWAESYVDSQDHSAVAVSGWARDYIDSQDHSAAAVSGWALETFLTSDDDSYVSGLALYASGHTLQSITDNGATTDNAITINNNLTAENLFGDLYGPIVFECKNDTGSQINAGTPVYVSGYYSNNGKPLIAPAIGNDSTKMPAVGILANNLTDGSEGHVHVFGEVPRINTSSFDVGDTVYVDPAGGLTNTRPTGVEELVQNIGRVLRSDASQGKILLLGPGRTNDVPNSGTFSELSVGGSDIISQITAVSGWAESYVDSQDHSAVSVSGALQPQITQNAADIVTVSGLLASSTQTFDSDITVSLGGGKTFGRYEDGDTIPASGRTANEVISLAITEPIAPTASLTSSSSVDFNQTAVSVTLNFSHTINSLGATVSSASLEFRRGNTGSWTVLSTSTSASSSYTHTFTDTANNTSQLNYRYTVTDSVSATTTVTKNINPDTYSSPSISFSVVADSTTSPETNSSRERGNVASTISGTISSNETYVDLITYTLQYSVDNGAWTDVGSAQSISGQSATISSTAHDPTSDNTATSIRYRIKVVDDYTTSYSSTSTISFGFLAFHGPSSSAPTTSSAVRSLPSRFFTSTSDVFNVNTGSTEVNFTVAIPSTETISEVIDLDALNANITSQYVNNNFNVNDAGGTAVSYNVYTMTQASAYSSSHRHQVTKG